MQIIQFIYYTSYSPASTKIIIFNISLYIFIYLANSSQEGCIQVEHLTILSSFKHLIQQLFPGIQNARLRAIFHYEFRYNQRKKAIRSS